jgi:hypothetical protein
MRRLSLFALLLASCAQSRPPAAPVAPLPPGPEGISGPYVHENLAVFLVHGKATDAREFLTLDDGLTSGLVKVSEKEEAEVNELAIENASEKPLFLQEGDRLQGGKQDRIIGTSLVVPPKSGRLPVPSFCVERDRWHGAAGQFGGTVAAGYADKGVRYEAKVAKDQGKVWEKVEGMKEKAAQTVEAPNTNSSLNETMDSEAAKKACAAYEQALARALEGREDAIGVAFVVSGRLEEAALYPNAALLRKVYPRLLSSYALAAALDRKAAPAGTVAAADVAAFMKDAASAKTETIDAKNVMLLTDYEKKVACETRYEGACVHRQWMRK